MDTDWSIVVFDIIILWSLGEIARHFLAGWYVESLLWLGVGFILIIFSNAFATVGDVFLALDYTAADTWLLQRPWRGHMFRGGMAAGFLIILFVLKYGDFSDARRK
jgi:hypothetical protein